jgi:hypothetical protein
MIEVERIYNTEMGLTAESSLKFSLKPAPFDIRINLPNGEGYKTFTKGKKGEIVRYFNAQDQLHREDGPAVSWPKGQSYWLQGQEVTQKEFEEFQKVKQTQSSLKLGINVKPYQVGGRPDAPDTSNTYSVEEVESFLQNITYGELPEYTRHHVEQRFKEALHQDPNALAFFHDIRINFKPHGSHGQDAEYFKDQNVIEWYAGWVGYARKGLFDKYTYSPRRVREEFIHEFMNRTMVHELTHVLQNYFDRHELHPSVAPYPDEEHPEYYKYQEVYHNDPGEMQAREVGKSLEFPVNKEFRRYYSLKFAWELPEGKRVRIVSQ